MSSSSSSSSSTSARSIDTSDCNVSIVDNKSATTTTTVDDDGISGNQSITDPSPTTSTTNTKVPTGTVTTTIIAKCSSTTTANNSSGNSNISSVDPKTVNENLDQEIDVDSVHCNHTVIPTTITSLNGADPKLSVCDTKHRSLSHSSYTYYQYLYEHFKMTSSATATMLSPANFSSAGSNHCAATMFLPNSPDEAPMADEEKPLDFSKSSNTSPKVFKHGHDGNTLLCNDYSSEDEEKFNPMSLTKSGRKLPPKYLKSDHCFTTPSPSPPERHSTMFTPPKSNSNGASMKASGDNLMHTANQVFGKLLNEGLLSQLQQGVNANLLNSGNNANVAANPLLKQAIQLAGLSADSSNPAALMSALMQSASINPQMANIEFIQNLNKSLVQSQTNVPNMDNSSMVSPVNPKISSPIAGMTANGQFQTTPFLVNQAANANLSPNSFLSVVNGSPSLNGGLLTTAAMNRSSGSPFSDPLSHSSVHPDSSTVHVSKSSNLRNTPPSGSSNNSKYTRPFKALYGKDTLTNMAPTPIAPIQLPVATDTLATQSILLSNSDQAYQEFRKQMLMSKRSGPNNRSARHSNGKSAASSSSSSGHSMGDLHSDDNNSNASNSSSGEGERGLDVESHHHHHHASYTSAITPTTVSSTPSSGANSLMSIPVTSSGNTMVTPPHTTHIPANITSSPQPTSNGTSANGRKRGRPLPDDLKDEAYWERRRKNNEAAKRSRDLRRAKEDEIAIRAAFLEQENFRLKCELIQAKIEYDKMRALWLNSSGGGNNNTTSSQQANSQSSITPEKGTTGNGYHI